MARIRFRWLIAKGLIKIGLTIWFFETVFYLVKYGWHLNPVNQIEKAWDDFANVWFFLGFVFFILTITSVIDQLIEEDN